MIDVINKNTDFQLLGLEQPITVVVKNKHDEIVYCNHANPVTTMEEIPVRVDFNGNIDEALREVETCDKCNMARIKIPSADYGEYDWTDWSDLI